MNGIYIIFNMISGGRYIGSSLDINNRFFQHRWMLNNGRHDNSHLQRAWDLYGEESFIFAPIITDIPEEDLPIREQYYMDLIPREYLYNSNEYAVRPPIIRGRKLSEEHKKIISEANRNRIHKPHTELSKLKMSNSHSRHYPAFINIETKEIIPEGINLAKTCREKHLHIGHMNAVMKGLQYSHKGWVLLEESNRKVNGHAKQYPALININTGEIINSGWNIRQLCRDKNLSRSTLKYMLRGKYKQHKGWVVYKEENDG